MYENALSVVSAGDSELCNYGWRLAAEDPATVVRFVRGRKMRTADALFDEIAAACQFPYYFGENWAAFAECLGDLDWLNASRFVLIFGEFDQVLAEDAIEIGAFTRAVSSAIDQFNEDRQNSTSGESLFRVIINGSLDATPLGGSLIENLGLPETLRIR